MSRRKLYQYGHPLPSRLSYRTSRRRRVPEIRTAYRKALSKRAIQGQSQSTIAPERQLFLGKEATVLRDMLAVIQAHARVRKTVIIRYTKLENGQMILREIEPYSIRLKNTRTRGKARYLYGYDLYRNEIRAFYLPNLQSVKGTNNTFNPRWVVEF